MRILFMIILLALGAGSVNAQTPDIRYGVSTVINEEFSEDVPSIDCYVTGDEMEDLVIISESFILFAEQMEFFDSIGKEVIDLLYTQYKFDEIILKSSVGSTTWRIGDYDFQVVMLESNIK